MRVARNGGLILMDGQAPLESTVLRRYAPLSRPPMESFHPPRHLSLRFLFYICPVSILRDEKDVPGTRRGNCNRPP